MLKLNIKGKEKQKIIHRRTEAVAGFAMPVDSGSCTQSVFFHYSLSTNDVPTAAVAESMACK